MNTRSYALRLAQELDAFPTAPHHKQAAAELRRLHAERAAADGVINDLVAKVRELQKENESLAAALASSCDEQRHELWESGGIAGCERARVAERQRDALLEALLRIESAVDWYLGRSSFTQTTQLKGLKHSANVRKELFAAHDEVRAAIKAVKEGK